MNLETLKVGDKVTIFGSPLYADSIKFAAVAKAGKRKVTLDDRSEWNMNGNRWGEAFTFSSTFITPYKPAHEEEKVQRDRENAHRTLANQLQRLRWPDLSLEVLREVKAIADREAKK